ncbi:hypothetical protein GCM10009117_18710 [Gangjinia marincola]|uniref:Uncharacterized protein n=1 Tax=Gangjinia marincola TaxID=578463 RepID=A0ABP3XXW5_9FLAO
MKKILLLLMVVFSTTSFNRTIEREVEIYRTTDDFFNDKSETVIAVIKAMSPDHIAVRKLIDKNTKKKIKKMGVLWGLKYKGEKYFHLFHSDDHLSSFIFVKLTSYEKPYPYVIVEPDSHPVLSQLSGSYGGVLTNVVVKEANKWNKNWTDSLGNKNKIVLIDLEDRRGKWNGKEDQFAKANWLRRKKYRELNPTISDTTKIKETPFEEVIRFLDQLNESN